MAKFISDGMKSPAMKQFAEMVVRQAGVPASEQISNRRAAQILLDYVRSNVRYRPDPDNTEAVQIAAITLCIPGAAMCIPVGDCDDLVVALASLMGAYGIPVKIVKQTFGENDEEEHVLVIFRTEDGDWLGADPSAPSSKPVGWRAPASKEVTVDPLDPKGTGSQLAEYVGIGARVGGLSNLSAGRLPPRQVMKVARRVGTLKSGWLPTIIYPSTVKDAQAQLLASAEGIDGAVQACSGLDAATKSSWTFFFGTLKAFCQEDPGIWGLGSRMDRVESYQTELFAWQNTISSANCQGVPAVPQPEQPSPGGGPWLPVAQLGLYTVLGVAGVYGLTQVLQKIPSRKVESAAAEARRFVGRSRRRRKARR